jgi:hypothetical protein
MSLTSNLIFRAAFSIKQNGLKHSKETDRCINYNHSLLVTIKNTLYCTLETKEVEDATFHAK